MYLTNGPIKLLEILKVCSCCADSNFLFKSAVTLQRMASAHASVWSYARIRRYTLGGVHMCTHTSSAHVIRTRLPLPSSARGVHMCTRPSSVKYVEYITAFCLSVGFYH